MVDPAYLFSILLHSFSLLPLAQQQENNMREETQVRSLASGVPSELPGESPLAGAPVRASSLGRGRPRES
jgi:hypothetical protein